MTNQGVRNLNDPNWKKSQPTTSEPNSPRPKKPINPLAMQSDHLEDLIYDHPSEMQEEIMAAWPEAKLTPTHDIIHEWRTEVDIPKCSRFDWYKFLVRTGLASISLSFRLATYMEAELIEAVLDAETPEWRTRPAKTEGAAE